MFRLASASFFAMLVAAYQASSQDELAGASRSDTGVIITAGQSNMAALTPKADYDPAFLMHADSIRLFWRDGEEPLASLWTDIRKKGGPWSHRENRVAQTTTLALADELIATGQADSVIVVPCAIGGSSLVEWLPDPEVPTREFTYFGNCLTAARLAMREGELRGLFFHQGESDARDRVRGRHWEILAHTVFLAFRDELDAPDLPIFLARLGDLSNDNKEREWLEDVIAAQGAIDLPCMTKIDTLDLPISRDGVHYAFEGQVELGKRLAQTLNERKPDC